MKSKTFASGIAVVALVAVLGLAGVGTASAQVITTTSTSTNTSGGGTITSSGTTINYATTTSTTTTGGTGTTSNLNLFIFGVTGNDAVGTSGSSGQVLGASDVGLPNTGMAGEAAATWAIVAAFLASLAALGAFARKNA